MKRILLIIAFLLWARPLLAQSDNFNRADAADLGANWTQQFGNNIKVSSNTAVAATANVDTAAFWNANSFNADQSSQATVSGALNFFGLTVRMVGTGGGSGVNGYVVLLQLGAATAVIQKMTDGSRSTLATLFTAAVSPGDTFKFSVTGTTLEVFQNGSSVGSTTDSTYSSGSPGLYINDNSGGGLNMDNWVGTGAAGGGGATAKHDLLLGIH